MIELMRSTKEMWRKEVLEWRKSVDEIKEKLKKGRELGGKYDKNGEENRGD